MKNCPFCKAEVQPCFPHMMQLENKQWSFLHVCQNQLSVFVCADTIEEVIAKWDRRATDEEHFTG